MRGRRKDKTESRRVIPVPHTPDAVGLCMSKEADVSVFKKKRTFPQTETSLLVEEALQKLSTAYNTSKSAEESKGADKPDKPEKVVHLKQWTIKLVPDSTGELWIVVLGAIEGTDNIAQSSFIKKRVNSHCVVSKSTTYMLKGAFEDTSIPYPGFRTETMSRFVDGFPHHWQSIIRSEISFIQKKENLISNANGVNSGSISGNISNSTKTGNTAKLGNTAKPYKKRRAG